MKYLINAFRGFCMALADSVPGVSGGTIAFILGFYDKFITSLNNIIFGNRKEKKEALLFLIKLGIGWIIGMISAVLVLTNLFESHIYAVSSVFLGFIMFSIPLIIKEEKKCLKGKYKNLIFTIIGIIIVSLITYFNPASGRSSFINVGRGKLVKEDDLVQFLDKFKGVALDVFENEPLRDDSPLWEAENVIVTPHNCWASDRNRERVDQMIYSNLKKYIKGETVSNLVNINRGY